MGQRGNAGERHSLARDHLEAALEASCEALVGLQLTRQVGGEAVKAQADQAIDSLRRAIVELRAARGEDQSALAHGFVTGESTEGSSGPR
jgi:hypothetical protein